MGRNYEIIGADDLVGWDEIVGADLVGADDDLDALLSAAAGGSMQVPQIGARSQAARLALALKAAQGKTLVSTRGPTKSREYPLGFDSGATLILAAAAGTITQRPQVPFKGKRIAVAASTAASFVITDIRVGKNSQLVASGNIPAETFAQTAQGVSMSLDTCQVSMDLQILVSNISLAPARFLATIIGDAVE